jgi:hypothetical protein
MEIRANGKIVEVEYGPDEQVTVARQHEVKAALQKAILKRPLTFFASNFSKTLEIVGTKVPIKVFENATAAREWLEQVV